MLKVDLHTHSGDDPQDRIRYSSRDLIDRAAGLGFDALAITNHNALAHTPALAAYAAARGLLLLPGVEITVGGCHVLVINPEFAASPSVKYTLADIPSLKTPGSLFIAPHPYFVFFQSLGKRIEAVLPYLDAIEFASYYNRVIDFNRPAVRLAARTGKPLIGTSDCHTVRQLGRTYSLIEAEKTPESILAAVKTGRVEVRSVPISLAMMASIVLGQFSIRKLARLFER
ncbi:MAG: PHP domain-containing protein [Candidatus Aminicenantes bacterium]|nr:PHP domain-containing protein [Candidatus Aminicenantes bacterium]